MRPLLSVLASTVLFLGLTLPAWAQPADCGTFRDVVCDGWFTDAAGVTDDPDAIETEIDAMVARFGRQIAFVVVDDTGSVSPADFAADLGNAWGVGSAADNDGIVILVSLGDRRTEVVTGSGIQLPATDIAASGNSRFGAGDFDGGIFVILGRLSGALEALEDGVEFPSTDDDTVPGGAIAGVLGVTAVGGVGVVALRSRQRKRDAVRDRRAELVDGVLGALEPAGHELPLEADYTLTPSVAPAAIDTAAALSALDGIATGSAPADPATLAALERMGAAIIVDRDRLMADTVEPLELRASQERPILEEAVQEAARDALRVDPGDETAFKVKLDDLERVTASLRPHRIAAARRRAAQSIDVRLTSTSLGDMTLTDLGERLLRAAPALDRSEPFADTVAELEQSYLEAGAKTETLAALYDKLPASTTRPAVAAALADLEDEPDEALRRYEEARTELERLGPSLESDGLDIPAIAALLLMNHDEADIAEFVDVYDANRSRGFEPGDAVEYALAGLKDLREVELVRAEAGRLGLPIAITAALLRRRDDGPEVYRELANALAGEGVTGDSRKTIAGILAISLEPAQAMRRWIDARAALAALGLEGSYADVAAAFGASDPRGPRQFALAYAAQRQALARSGIADADRFAPELAHAGTRRSRDSWTGEPIPRGLATFDPYTLLFYHWVITRGHHGSYGWEPIYRDQSWAGDRSSWWGGGGGFGGSGSSWGGSSWGSGSMGGGFGGFGGGGGFSGGGGSSW